MRKKKDKIVIQYHLSNLYLLKNTFLTYNNLILKKRCTFKNLEEILKNIE